MTQAKPRFLNFEDYLASDQVMEGRYELINGELVALPPESGVNNLIARFLLVTLVAKGLIPLPLVVNHSCELQVRVLEPNDPANRYPDLVILREEHLPLIQQRLTITLDMPPPRLVVEVVSPGKANRERDYLRKRAQYADIGIPEYWMINPEAQTIVVLDLRNQMYQEFGVFQGRDLILSLTFPTLDLLAEQVFRAEL